MRKFNLESFGLSSLQRELSGPLLRLSAPDVANGIVPLVRLWTSSASYLNVWSEMHDLDQGPGNTCAYPEEISTLAVERSSEPVSDLFESILPAEFGDISRAGKLVAKPYPDVEIECGIELRFRSGTVARLMSGQFPCSVAIEGLPGFPDAIKTAWPSADYEYRDL